MLGEKGGSRGAPWGSGNDSVRPDGAEDAHGAELQLDDGPARDGELFLVDGNNLAYRAFFALPEELATSRRLPDERAARVRQHALQAARRLPAEGRRGRLGPGPTHRLEVVGGVQGRAPADAGPAARAVPALPADRRGLRLPQPRVRRLGGGRRHRHDRDAADEAGIKTCVVSTDRDAFQLCSENVPDDDAARRRRRPGVHARARRGPLRHPAREGAGLHRPQGRHLRQHPGRSRASATRPPGSSSRSSGRSRRCSTTWTT